MVKIKKDLPKFYEKFKLGLEIEMETTKANYRRAMETDPDLTNLKVVSDGSLRNTKPNTSVCEVICTEAITSEKEQAEFIEAMKKSFQPWKSKEDKEIFAYHNMSCSTHIHFSFKEEDDKMLWIFDTKDFEWFLFKEYLTKFNSEKFLERLGNNYCKNPNIEGMDQTEKAPLLKKIKGITIKELDDEKRKVDDKYRWLNTRCIDEGTGIEIRLFPHIQTYKGLELLIEWFQATLIKYTERKQVQIRMNLLKFYNTKCANKTYPMSKLNEFKQLVWGALKLNENKKSHWSGDIRILLAKWAKEQPSLLGIESTNEVI